MDIEKNFDCTRKHRVICKINVILCHGNLLNLITQFLQIRTFQVKLSNLTYETFFQENGIPQRPSQCTTLFLIATNDISNSITSLTKNIIADDL